MEKKIMKKENALPLSVTPGGRKPIQTDPLGSYTGRPDIPYEIPVQDADDL